MALRESRARRRSAIARWVPWAAPAAIGLLLGLWFLPVDVVLDAQHRGWEPLGAGFRVAAGTAWLLAGAEVRLRLPEPACDLETMLIEAALRRSSNPVTLSVTRGTRILLEQALNESMQRLAIPIDGGPRPVALRIQARARRIGPATLYRVRSIVLQRTRWHARRGLILLPAVAGLLGVALARRSATAPLAALWGVDAAVLALAAVLARLDPIAALRLADDAPAGAALLACVSAALLVLIPRLPALSRQGCPRFAPGRVLLAAAGVAAAMLGLSAALVSTSAGLGWLLPDPGAAAPLARAALATRVLLSAAAAVVYLGLFAATSARVDRLGERGLAAAVFGLLTASLLASSEAIAAVRYPPVYPLGGELQTTAGGLYVRDPHLGHRLKPGAREPYRINALGFRGEEFPLTKAADERRIVVFGDSVVFGTDVAEGIPFPAQLQRLLTQEAGARWRVVNAGVPAYDSLQVRRAAERRLPELGADIVVVMVGWNDISWGLAPDWHSERAIDSWGRPATFRPALVRMFQERATARAARAWPHPDAVRAFRENLGAVAELAGSRGLPLVLTNLPTILSRHGNSDTERRRSRGKLGVDWKAEWVEQLEAQLAGPCARPGVVCVRSLFPLEEAAKLEYFLDHCHLSAKGHAVVAERLRDALRSAGLLRATSAAARQADAAREAGAQQRPGPRLPAPSLAP